MGLVEISALATLIGASSAEALSTGAKGAGGLPWATMSMFGMLHAIKGCASASVPDWFRDAVGLRSSAVDAAVGMAAAVDATKPPQGTPMKALAIDTVTEEEEQENEDSIPMSSSGEKSAVAHSVQALTEASHILKSLSRKGPTTAVQAIQAFSHTTEAILITVPASSQGSPIPIHQFQHVGSGRLIDTDKPAQLRRDMISLLASLIKLTETYTLWRMNGGSLWWITTLSWLHAFISATLLLALDLSVDKFEYQRHDLITGDFPTPLYAGGSAKLVLGLPGNVRRHRLWTTIWATGTIVNCAALLLVFVTLSGYSTPDEAVYIWAGFQGLWLFCRIFIFQAIPAGLGPRREGLAVPQLWSQSTPLVRKRTLRLMMGLARQLITVHPRGIVPYQEDLLDMGTIRGLLGAADNTLTEFLPAAAFTGGVELLGVLGDTVFRSVGWITGTLQGPDIYDCVLVFIKLESTGVVHAVPSVRVLAGIAVDDVEAKVSTFDPRGTANNGKDIKWVYWIPAVDSIGQRVWMEVRGMKVLGKVESQLVTQVKMQGVLQSGMLNVSFNVFDEVLQALGESRGAAATVLGVFVDAGVVRRRV